MATRVSLARHRALVTVIPCHKCPCELVISNVKNMFGYCLVAFRWVVQNAV